MSSEGEAGAILAKVAQVTRIVFKKRCGQAQFANIALLRPQPPPAMTILRGGEKSRWATHLAILP